MLLSAFSSNTPVFFITVLIYQHPVRTGIIEIKKIIENSPEICFIIILLIRYRYTVFLYQSMIIGCQLTMAFSERIVKHRSVFEVKPVSHNPPGINDFEIIKPVSKGAFGSVHLARRKDSDKIYALKSMKKSDVMHKNMMEQVVIERDALAISSKSSFVVQLYYSFQNKENIFLVMEYMIGGDLKSLLHNVGYFDEGMAKFYIAEITLALEYLHSHSIIHSDIKPDNMLLSAKGHLKLTDFGLSTLSTTTKPTAFDLVKHNTPYRRMSQDHMKPPGNVFWRTPGQLQSLVCKFTFSSPKPNQRIEKKRFAKLNNNSLYKNVEFEFSSPGQLSYNTTPCGLQKQVRRSSNSAIFEHEPSKLLSAFKREGFNKNCRKRTYTNQEKENTPKRFRTSLPVELETAVEHPKGNPVASSPNNVTELDLSGIHAPSDTESSYVQNMSVDASVFNESNRKADHDDLSGVSILPESETSAMSVSYASEFNQNCTYTEPPKPQAKRKSLLKDTTVRWCENSPQILGQTLNDEIRFQTPIKTLKFQLDEEDEDEEFNKADEEEHNESVETTAYVSKSFCSSTVSDESIHFANTPDATLNDTPSCEVFNMPFRNQTPFRTPKSCVRGKVPVTEKRKIQGTPDYLAPEILIQQEIGPPADWWALGVCYYEFVTGVPPFNDDTPDLVFKHILAHEMIWPEDEESLGDDTVLVIEWLLSPDPAERPIAGEMKQLSSFCNINWDNLQNEPAPFIPQPDNIYDTTYFDAKNQARQFQMSDFVIEAD